MLSSPSPPQGCTRALCPVWGPGDVAGSPFALKTGFLRYVWTPRVPGWGQVLGAEHLWGWQCGVADMKRVGTHRGDGRAG